MKAKKTWARRANNYGPTKAKYAKALTEAIDRSGGRHGRLGAGACCHTAARDIRGAGNHPRHIQNDIFRYPRYPLGIEPDNIDHEGLPQDPLRSGFDWGEGGALAAAAGLLQNLGSAFADFRRNIAVGVDGVNVKSFKLARSQIQVDLDNLLGALPFPYRDPYPIELRIEGLPAGKYQLVLNSTAAQPVELLASQGILLNLGPQGIH